MSIDLITTQTSKRLAHAFRVLTLHRQAVIAYAWEHDPPEICAWARAEWGVVIGRNSLSDWLRRQPDYDANAAHAHRKLRNGTHKPKNPQFPMTGHGVELPRPGSKWACERVTDEMRLSAIRCTLEAKLAAGRYYLGITAEPQRRCPADSVLGKK